MFRALALFRIHCDKGLMLEMSASESLYGGQFTLSTQLIKPNYLVILTPTQHQFLLKLTPFIHIDKYYEAVYIHHSSMLQDNFPALCIQRRPILPTLVFDLL